MNTSLRVFSIAILLVAFAQPAVAAPDDNHDKWIDVLSIDWGTHTPGAKTDLKDGNYKDKKGRYIVVQRGKVVTRGWDYKKKEPIRGTANKPQDTQVLQKPLNKSATPIKPKRVKPKPRPQEGVEPDEIDNK